MKQKKTFSSHGDSLCRHHAAQKGHAVSHSWKITSRGGNIAPHGGNITSCEESPALANGRNALRKESAALSAWWAKYASVENAIVSSQDRRRRRAKAKRRNRAREFGDICEMTDGLAVRWRRDGFFEGEEFALIVMRDMGYYAYLDFMRRESGRRVSRLKAYVRRPSYYAAENARRRALAAERRKIRNRRTDNACPTKEQILDAWIARRKSHEDAIRFGSLIEDLECYIDNSLRRDEDGVIVGRNPGVKGWLRENIPALALQYTTVMRYKAAAKKLKQITELADPTPMDVVLPSREPVSTDVPSVGVVRARAIWEEVIKGAGDSATALFERLDALTDPGRVEDANMLAAWREKYVNEITERTKRKWWLKRLWKSAG